LAAGLCPDPVGELKRFPRPIAAIRGPTSKERERKGKEGRGNRRGKGKEGREENGLVFLTTFLHDAPAYIGLKGKIQQGNQKVRHDNESSLNHIKTRH